MAIDKKFLKQLFNAHQSSPEGPSPQQVTLFFQDLLGMLFAEFSPDSFASETDLEQRFSVLRTQLDQILAHHPEESTPGSINTGERFFGALPTIYTHIDQDVTAMFEGDPAAKSRSEVIRTYPGFYAISAYRIAHQLHVFGVKEIPRIITEHAHSKTGIDIHPAADIGLHFCIDHGTGVVIGETAVIGDHVKIYQGVTLGALSVSKEDAEKKRHPTLEDHVVVYAGATILGGDTTIGHNSIIGGNVWLTQSVKPYSKIYYQSKMYNGETEETDLVIFKNDRK